MICRNKLVFCSQCFHIYSLLIQFERLLWARGDFLSFIIYYYFYNFSIVLNLDKWRLI
jgi:hypothetical protein